MKLTAYIDPMGAVRMTQAGKWTSPSAMKYLRYKEAIGWQLKEQVQKRTSAALSVKATFYMPIPESWAKTKKLNASNGSLWHTAKPDIDNLVKGLFDAANGVVWEDDKLVIECQASKQYDLMPRIELEVKELF